LVGLTALLHEEALRRVERVPERDDTALRGAGRAAGVDDERRVADVALDPPVVLALELVLAERLDDDGPDLRGLGGVTHENVLEVGEAVDLDTEAVEEIGLADHDMRARVGHDVREERALQGG